MACLSVLVSVVLGAVSGHPTVGCRCVPDQWEGILASTDREFDLTGGQAGSMDNNLYVSYDFRSKRFAMTDLKTGNKAIADYRKGYKYVIRHETCQAIRTAEDMRQMCLPEHAEFMGEFSFGTDIPVDLWQFTGPYNVSMKTTVVQQNCVPLTEEVYMTKGAYASLTSSTYLDVTLGIKDESVFEPPFNCAVDAQHGPMANHIKRKRAGGAWSLLGKLNHNSMYTSN